jgi:hypothetical protein
VRHQPLSHAPLRARIWRAIALGFSVTALALNVLAALAPSLTSGEASAARPSSGGSAPRQPRLTAWAPEGVQPSETHGQSAAAPNDDAALAQLARRFSDAADADLGELASALATRGGARARQVLFTAVRSSRPSSQVAALEALGTIDMPDVREFMLAQLNEPEPPVAAVNYFADCQEPRALPALERLARDAPQAVRGSVIASLFAQGESAEPVILRLLRGDDELSDALLGAAPVSARARRVLRQASVQRLRAGAITQGPVFDFLEQDLSSEAREALLVAARDPASAASALTALSKRADRASLGALTRLANDSDRSLAARASCALRAETGSRTRRVQRHSIQ